MRIEQAWAKYLPLFAIVIPSILNPALHIEVLFVYLLIIFVANSIKFNPLGSNLLPI